MNRMNLTKKERKKETKEEKQNITDRAKALNLDFDIKCDYRMLKSNLEEEQKQKKKKLKSVRMNFE